MQKLRNYYAVAATVGLLMPALASAQTFLGSFNQIKGFIANFVPFLILLATVLFLWGVVRYITAGGDEERLKEGRNLMIYGIIALAVMVGVWGFVNLFSTFIFNEAPSNIIPPGPKQN